MSPHQCRRRRVKCDEVRPSCLTCRATGLTCGGYGRNIFFTSRGADPDIHGPDERFRRHLFTPTERERMSQWLTSSVPPSQVLRRLLQMEEESEHASSEEHVGIQRGPFGVFRQIRPRMPSAAPSDACRDDEPAEGTSLASPTWEFPDDRADQQWVSSAIESILDDAACDILLPTFGLCDPADGEAEHGFSGRSIFDEDLPSTECTQGSPDPLICEHANPYVGAISGTGWESHLLASTTPLLSAMSNNIPYEAVFLLRHFTSDVVSCITPFEHTKTPWHVLFIPHVKACLAALTIGEDLCDASLAGFFGTLAISAASLDGRARPQPTRWRELTRGYQTRAVYHAHCMLLRAYKVPKTAKYKSIVMALLTLISLFGVTSNRRRYEFYILETEKFIRTKGLNRRKSRKVRLLHHCYAFQRIFFESLCFGNTDSRHRREVELAAGASGIIIGQDRVSFRLPEWHDLPQEMLVVKTQEEGENDLLLERPGTWYATLYPEIFGIPERLILLLSLAIRLGREKDAAEREGAACRFGLQEYLSRARALERCILQVQETTEFSADDTPRPGRTDKAKLVALISATRHALEIYFYRRVYNVDASLLQHKVASVMWLISRPDSAGSPRHRGSLCLLWPAFIAACEAEDPGLQRSFSAWFEACARDTGLDAYASSLGLIREAWRANPPSNKSRGTWIDVLKNRGW